MCAQGQGRLEESPQPTDEKIRWGIAGNLCPCTNYSKIVKAIRAAAGEAIQSNSEA